MKSTSTLAAETKAATLRRTITENRQNEPLASRLRMEPELINCIEGGVEKGKKTRAASVETRCSNTGVVDV